MRSGKLRAKLTSHQHWYLLLHSVANENPDVALRATIDGWLLLGKSWVFPVGALF